jgi:hypothetical protein
MKVIGPQGKVTLFAHLIDVDFAPSYFVAGVRIARILYDVVQLMKKCPANVESSKRWLISH